MASRHDAVILWRLKTLEDDDSCPEITPQVLADSLSCEGLPQGLIPKNMEKRVTAFRHLHRDERYRRCHSVLLELETYRRELESHPVKTLYMIQVPGTDSWVRWGFDASGRLYTTLSPWSGPLGPPSVFTELENLKAVALLVPKGTPLEIVSFVSVPKA